MEGISIGRDRAGTVMRDSGRVTSPIPDSATTDGADVSLRLNSLTDFEEFFAPLYPLLADYSWLVDGAGFSFPDNQATGFSKDVLARYGDCRYFRSGSLERWTPYLVDDWCTVLGFRAIADDPRTLVKTACGRLTDANILALTPRPDCVFHCIDAARWTFYAQDEALLTVVREHAASRPALRVWSLRFGEDVTR